MSTYYHVSTECAYMSGKVYMIACVCVCGVVRLHAHTATQTLTVRTQTNPEHFSRPRAEPCGPWDRAPCCPPGSCQGKVLLCATAWPPSKGRAAGEHMLDVTHGCTDTRVRGHAFIQTTTLPTPLHIPPHTHTHNTTWI